MKKAIAVLVICMLALCPSALAHTKSFDAYQSEIDNTLANLQEANRIKQACQDCIDGFNDGDKDKQEAAYKIIVEAGLMPEHYKIKDTTLIEPFLYLYEKYSDAYRNEWLALMGKQGYWAKNTTLINQVYKKALDGEVRIYPSINTKKYNKQIILGLPDDFFDDKNDLEKYFSNIYLVKGVLYENDADDGYCFIQYVDEKYGNKIICAMNPNQYNPNVDYLDLHNMPDEGEELYFLLTFFMNRESDNLKVFYLGADDLILDSFRLYSTEYDPE